MVQRAYTPGTKIRVGHVAARQLPGGTRWDYACRPAARHDDDLSSRDRFITPCAMHNERGKFDIYAIRGASGRQLFNFQGAHLRRGGPAELAAAGHFCEAAIGLLGTKIRRGCRNTNSPGMNSSCAFTWSVALDEGRRTAVDFRKGAASRHIPPPRQSTWRIGAEQTRRTSRISLGQITVFAKSKYVQRLNMRISPTGSGEAEGAIVSIGLESAFKIGGRLAAPIILCPSLHSGTKSGSEASRKRENQP